jgi:hypothetical protein
MGTKCIHRSWAIGHAIDPLAPVARTRPRYQPKRGRVVSLRQERLSAVIFICPMTDLNVQYRLDDDEGIPENEYEVVTCPACAKVHLINRKTGRPLTKMDSQPASVH